jgi:hypothetical protein
MRAQRYSILAACAVLITGLLGVSSAQARAARVLVVSPTGRGTACAPDTPCDLAGLRTKLAFVQSHPAGEIDVQLHGGIYRLSDTLRLGPGDSGSPGSPVIFMSYPGEKPVLSGAIQVQGFQLYDAAAGIYRASVPAGTQSRQLFVDGVRAQRARGPMNPGGFAVSGSSFVTSDPSYLSFTNQSQIEVVQNSDWKQLRCPLTSITAAGNGSSLNVDPGCWRNNNAAVPSPGFPFNGAGLPRLDGISWVENAYQLLTRPGQFYLDSAAGYLYYLPRAGENLATAEVELPTVSELLDLSGTPGHLAVANDTDPSAVYAGSWGYSWGRPFGDFGDDVHYTTTNGDSVSIGFSGTGINVLSEVVSDEGTIDVYVDGAFSKTVSAYGPTRVAQQPVVSVSGLAPGQHTVKLVKTGGQYMVIDGFTVIPDVVAPVHDISFRGITFQDTTWNQPSTSGYVDNQAGVLWDPATHLPYRIPAAVQVHRGQDITFSGVEIARTGGTGIDFADGTQNSSVADSWIHDTAGGGVSVGEVDDYYLTDPALMTSGDTVARDWIDHVGQDYADAVGVWAGHTRTLTVTQNDIGHTPYSGVSLGWGWGWASSCDLQAKQGLSNPCRHGSTYAGGNRITGNHIHDVMGVLNDGGPIYTNGGQGGGDGSLTSVVSGNLLEGANHTNNMLYHDEGSSYWDTYSNLVRFGGGSWTAEWTPTIHDITVHGNYSDNPNYYDNGTNVSVVQATIVYDGAWPDAAVSIMAAAGPGPAQKPNPNTVDDDDQAIRYLGSWFTSGFRGLGDYNDGVHANQNDGDSATLTFTGTGVAVRTETNSDEGNVAVAVDGVPGGVVSAYSTTRQAQTIIYQISGLAPGQHTIQLTKAGGQYMLVDRFDIN